MNLPLYVSPAVAAMSAPQLASLIYSLQLEEHQFPLQPAFRISKNYEQNISQQNAPVNKLEK